MADLKNKIDFVYVFDVQDGNLMVTQMLAIFHELMQRQAKV